MKRYIIQVILLLAFSTAMAQEANGTAEARKKPTETQQRQYATRVIKGRVLKAAGNIPLSGAMVGTAGIEGYSTLTRTDGTYELNLPAFATSLQVTSPGYNTVRIGLSSGDVQRDIMLYDETFRADYNADTDILNTSTTSSFRYSSAVTIEEEVQKQLGADVHVVTRNGTPGIGGVMFLNGINSLHINAQPLIVVDGVILDQQYGRTMLHDGFYNDILSNISPADIEKVTVLRNGTALYGAKGANGVLLVQTRRNKSMATRITASLSAGITLEPKYLDVMNASQFKSYASDLLATTNTPITNFKFLNEDPSYYYYPQYHNDTDWKSLVYRTAITQNYNINVEGGDDVANYNLSLGYTNNQSTLKNNGMNRLNIRFNTDIKLTTRFTVRFDASFANQTRNLRNDGAPADYDEGTPTSPAFLAYTKSPMLSPYAYANGELSDSYIDISDETYLDEALAEYTNYNYRLANPVAVNEYGEAENKNRFENSMINISVTPTYSFNSHLKLSEHFSYNLVNTNGKYYIPLNGVPSYYVTSVGAFRENEIRSLFSKQNSVTSDTRIDWNNNYGPHSIHLFAGARINWENYKLNSQWGYNTGSDKTPFMSSSLLNANTVGNTDKWNSIAWYAQAQYNYRQRYYLQANLTAEASSRFGRDAADALKAFDAAWGIFPGIHGAWVVSNEKWFADTKGIDYLRLDIGYDVSGNDDIDCFAARSYFSSAKFLQAITGISFGNIGNNRLQWETTRRLSAGFETNLVDNRINLRFNWFSSTTSNLLTFQNLDFITGLEKNWSNDGKLKNQGFDVSLTAKIINSKNFQWELGASAGHYKNRITALADGRTYEDTNVYGATIRTETGKPANMFYGYKTLGVFSTSEEAAHAALYILDDNGVDRHYFGAGDMHFADINGDHRIDEADRVFIGDPNPDIHGNIFTSMAYKKWRIDINFNYSLGNDVYNYMRSQLEGGSRFMNQTKAMTRRWQTEKQITDMPKATFQDPMGNSRFSDRWIEDGSYLRLKSLTLSYTLPVNTTFLQGLEFWIQGNNLLTFSRYLGSDPEFSATSSVIGQGIDLGQLPQSRSIVAGVKINL